MYSTNSSVKGNVYKLYTEYSGRGLAQQAQKLMDPEAVKKEEASWDKYNPVIPVPDDKAKEILADKELRKRCMRSRCAYRDKNCGRNGWTIWMQYPSKEPKRQ